jgi:hypothetical protein
MPCYRTGLSLGWVNKRKLPVSFVPLKNSPYEFVVREDFVFLSNVPVEDGHQSCSFREDIHPSLILFG